MLKRIAFFLAFLFFASMARGQSANLAWIASTSSGVTGYNVYRAPCTNAITGNTCTTAGTFAKINGTLVLTTTYVDSAGQAGNSYDYYVTAVCPTLCTPTESVASNHFAVTIPKQPPQPPTGLTITSTTRAAHGNQVTVTASWTDAPLIKTTYTLAYVSGGALLTGGTAANTTGVYSMTWTGKVTPPTASLTFKVCDSTGVCTSAPV